MKKEYIKYIIWIVGGVASYFVLRKLGIFKSALEREGERNIAESYTYSDILQQRQNATLSETELRAIAASIKNSWGFFNDDEEKIYNAFSRLGNTDDLKLVLRYYGKYKDEGLEDSINNRMSTREVSKINEILAQKGINFAF